MKQITVFFLPLLFILSIFQGSQGQENATETSEGIKTSTKFKGLVLENGLKVILISVPDSPVAIGYLHVAAGSMSDPKEVQGLAHLLQRVLLLAGNEKYPEPGAFSKYLAANGESIPANTYQDYTEYGFGVLSAALEGAANHLFHMIHDPLLLESSIREGVTAVDKKHARNVRDDYDGIGQIERHTSHKDHPFNNFPNGNEETLWKKPQQLGINVTEELIKYHETYYSANIMTLAILDKRNFTDLEEMVTTIFSKLKNKNTTLPSWPESPFGPEELGVKIEIIPKGGRQFLALEFPIPADSKDSFNNYYSKLFSRGGNQSLSEFLKSANLVSTLFGHVYEKYRGFYVFSISARLTEFGVIHHERVVVHVFEFISFLRTEPPKEWFWDEVKIMEDMAERFTAETVGLDLVSNLGKYMIKDSPQEAVRKYFNKSREQFNATKVGNALLNYITPENMRMYFTSSTVKNTTSFEPNYKIDYSMRPLDPTFKQSLEMAVPNPDVQFPPKNEYLPKNFTIKPLPINNTGDVPKIVESTNFSTIWFLQDNHYFVPKAGIFVKLFNPTASITPVDSNLNYIMQSIMEEVLEPITRSASVAETVVSVSDKPFGLEVWASGYNDGIDKIMYKVMETISSISFTNESFHKAKDHYRWFQDARIDEPDALIVLSENVWTPQQLSTALNDITVEDLELFYRRFISRLRMEWLIYGNVLEEEATQMVKTSEELFIKRGSRPGSKAEFKWQSRNVQIPKGTNWLYKMTTTKQTRTCIRVAFQTPKPDLKDRVKITLLADIMTYVELLDKEQLGSYVRFTPSRELGYSSNTLEIFVQGDNDPAFVEGRISQVLLMFRETLKNMTKEEFEARKLILWTKWGIKANQLESLGFTYWDEISHGHCKFERNAEKQTHLHGLTLPELQKFYDELIGFGNGTGQQRRLSIHVALAKYSEILTTQSPVHETTTEMGDMFPPDEESNNLNKLTMDFLNQTLVEIMDLAVWKRGQFLYPTTGLN